MKTPIQFKPEQAIVHKHRGEGIFKNYDLTGSSCWCCFDGKEIAELVTTALVKKKKRAKSFPATGESVKYLERDGWTCWKVEQRIPTTWITLDAFGFGDILAMSPSRGIMLVQATGGDNGASRIAKIRSEPRSAIWLASGGRIQVHDHVKRVGIIGRVLRIMEITKISSDDKWLAYGGAE